MISRGYAVRHILFVEISRKTGYDLIRGRDVVKCHDLFLWRIADGPALDTLDETLPKKFVLSMIIRIFVATVLATLPVEQRTRAGLLLLWGH